MGAEPTSSGPVELRDYPAVLRRRLAQPEPVAAVAAKVAADHRHPARLLEHVQVDMPANSQTLRVRYRDTVPKTAHRRFEQNAPFLHPLLVVKQEHLVADPEDTLAQIPAFLDLEGDIPSDGIDPTPTGRAEAHPGSLVRAGQSPPGAPAAARSRSRRAQPELRRARRAARRSVGTVTLPAVPVPMWTSGLWWP
jgi:hypothetical protein